MKTHWTYRNECVTKTKRVDHGYWECCEVPAPFKDFCNRVKWSHSRHDCCECPPCPATKTVKKWHCNWVTECYTENCCKKVCVQVPEVCNVTVTRCVPKQVVRQVTEYVCTPTTRTENYTCYETRQVPFTATRNVTVCVPYEECVTCCRMVARTVYRQVPAPTCGCETECTPCCSSGHRGHGLLSGRGHHSSCSSCSNGCGCH
jgi:hypothetical protein